MPFRVGVITSHLNEISESMGFPLVGRIVLVAAASAAVISSAFWIVREVGVTRFYSVVLLLFSKL